MGCTTRLGQKFTSREYDRRTAGPRLRIAVQGRFAGLGMPVTQPVALHQTGKREVRQSGDLHDGADGPRSPGKGGPWDDEVAPGTVRKMEDPFGAGPRSTCSSPDVSGGRRVRRRVERERPGGGGFGDPEARDPDAAETDRRRGYVSGRDG